MKSIIIVEKQAHKRDVIHSILLNKNMVVMGTAANGYEALRLVETHAPEIVLMSSELPAISAIELLELLNKRHYPGRTMVITPKPDEQLADNYRQQGAAALIGEQNLEQDLPRALDAVTDGYAFFPWYQVIGVVEEGLTLSIPLSERLSAQEHKVLQYLLKGMSNCEIARVMGLSGKTVSTYKTRVLQKMQVKNLVELVKKLTPAVTLC